MEQKKIYIVTAGCYSAYGISAVFSTHELAEEYCDRFDDDYRIEEYDIDKPMPKPEEKIWSVALYLDNREECMLNTYEKYDQILYTVKLDEDRNHRPYLTFGVRTDSRKKAVKIVNEQMNAVLANEQTRYPYLRERIVKCKCGPNWFDVTKDYPTYDIRTGEVIVDEYVDINQSVFTDYNAYYNDEDGYEHINDYLPDNLRVRLVKVGLII